MGLMDRDMLRGAICLLALLGAATYSASAISADTPLEEGCCVVNVNTATKQELRSVPGIGPELAERIIKKRPFKRVDGLLRVDGIGKKSLKKMRPYLRVEGKTERL